MNEHDDIDMKPDHSCQPIFPAGCFVTLIAFALTILLGGCMINTGYDPTTGAKYSTATLGVDATDFEVSPQKTKIIGLVQSKALMHVADKIEAMWSNYLIFKGLTFSLGKYYDHAGKVVDADTSLKLEGLRNAKSEADAAARFKELDLLSKVKPAA